MAMDVGHIEQYPTAVTHAQIEHGLAAAAKIEWILLNTQIGFQLFGLVLLDLGFYWSTVIL